MALTAGILMYLVVDKQPAESGKKTDDYTGVATISISLVSLMYALN